MLNKYLLLSPENTSKKLKWHLGPAGTVICMAITKEREEINMDSINFCEWTSIFPSRGLWVSPAAYKSITRIIN
jgi:hypothetical protein